MRLGNAFLLVVAAQAGHSFEEYLFRLYDELPVPRMLSDLVSSDRAEGFLYISLALTGFGLWCWAGPIRREWPSKRIFAWGWALVGMANGAGHIMLAVGTGGYFPGVMTAPLLLVTSAVLMANLRKP